MNENNNEWNDEVDFTTARVISNEGASSEMTRKADNGTWNNKKLNSIC